MSFDSVDRPTETTVDHKRIKVWAEERDGIPALASAEGARPTRLRIAFPPGDPADPSADDESIEEISWARFFDTFDAEGLAFRFGEADDPDDRNVRYEFVDREDADVVEGETYDDLIGDTVTSRTATSVAEAEPGMDVVDVSEGTVGVVSQVKGAHLYVDPDPGLTDRVKIEMGWGDAAGDEDVYEVSENRVESIEGDRVRIYRPE